MRFVRNQASHQEPLIGSTESSQQEMKRLCGYLTSIDALARSIDPAAADWIGSHSRTLAILAQQPNKP
ncbi:MULTISPECIES: hypothetical protein [unclassified Corynebacterium]|uniref:hypothetical protein n=1 Tax=unclassified Corynebacterium TaxID=2624378 RepID=UPI0029C9DBB6|nr:MULTISPECIES: hypothetical protein [unclassified Corynebacterium]WPF65987.1 hypothetical protein OLX12_10600 [Corynebacterium sp. 22KM0430]WPF68480.1 hypothetical protein OLW90_10595 [Corynebacterium sp. 21KM1197]